MKAMHVGLISLLLFSTPAFSAERSYVLKRNDGEKLMGDIIVLKATPRTGTQGGEMLTATLPPGFSTGLHVHKRADEFFFVIAGEGSVILGDKELEIGPGDVFFVARGSDHQLRNKRSNQPLELVAFLDKPGLANEFRAVHRHFQNTGKPPTLEELNRIARKFGTVYKTVN